MAAMGRSGSVARYGVEFYTVVLTAGPNATTGSTGADGTTRYLQMMNSSRALFIANGWCTAVSGYELKPDRYISSGRISDN